MEKEVKTIGQEVTKAVETMKEAGKQGKQPQQQPEKEEKPDTPKSKGKNPKKDEAAKLQEEINRKIEALRLPQPEKRTLNGLRLTLSYTNFFIANGGIVMSGFDDKADDTARGVLQDAFPGRKIIQLPALPITSGGGGIHCITQQQPSGELAR